MKYIHLRYHRPVADTPEGHFELESRGGVTIGIDKAEHGLNFAVAYCCQKDNFNRKIGRTIVQNRMMNDDFYKLVCSLETDEDKQAAIDFILRKVHANLKCVTNNDIATEFVW